MRYLKDIKKFVQDKMVFCGIDVHHEHWNLCYFCNGEVVEKLYIVGDFEQLRGHTEKQYSSASSVQFAYEAGFSGFWLHRSLSDSGYECVITPPNRIPSNPDKVKTDKKDSEKLARYLAGGLLKKVYVPPPTMEADRQLLRLRAGQKKKLSRVKNQINSLLHLQGLSWSSDNGCRWTKRFISWLEVLEFSQHNFRFILDQYIEEYRFLSAQIEEITKYIRDLARSSAYERHIRYLTACKGIGLITAMTFLLELGDIARFPDSVSFSSYLGLTPSQHSSGQHVRLGHITREGNAHIRGVLIESAWTVIRHDPFLREKYNRIKARGTNGKKAIVAVAHSLAIRLRRCILNEEPYVVGIC